MGNRQGREARSLTANHWPERGREGKDSIREKKRGEKKAEAKVQSIQQFFQWNKSSRKYSQCPGEIPRRNHHRRNSYTCTRSGIFFIPTGQLTLNESYQCVLTEFSTLKTPLWQCSPRPLHLHFIHFQGSLPEGRPFWCPSALPTQVHLYKAGNLHPELNFYAPDSPCHLCFFPCMVYCLNVVQSKVLVLSYPRYIILGLRPGYELICPNLLMPIAYTFFKAFCSRVTHLMSLCQYFHRNAILSAGLVSAAESRCSRFPSLPVPLPFQSCWFKRFTTWCPSFLPS